MKITTTILLIIITVQLYACNNNNVFNQQDNRSTIKNTDTMKIIIGSHVFDATLFDTETAAAFKTMLPLTITMIELNGNEKYCDLSHDLPAKASNPRTINEGDIMLYGKNTLVLFYKTFSTSYSYTKIGHIINVAALKTVLVSDNVTMTFENKNN